MEVIKTMKKYEWYMIQCEVKQPWIEKWETRAELFKTMKEVRKILENLKKHKEVVRNTRVFKVAPYEDIDI